MKYDLIVAGGGPAGLMAAKTAAEDGLKVVLLERKKEVTAVNRLCGQFTNIKMLSVGGKVKYGYVGKLNLEVGTTGVKVHFPDEKFSIDYSGPLRPYINYTHVSPSGHLVYREKGHIFGFFLEKDSLLRSLIEPAVKAGAEIRTECFCMSAEDSGREVKVTYRNPSGEGDVIGKRLIIADGKESKLVDSLGWNKKRQIFTNRVTRAMGYELEGIDTEIRLNSWVCFTVPSISLGNFWMYQMPGDRNVLGVTGFQPEPEERVKKMMAWPAYAGWFKKARLVRKWATAGITSYTPLMEPASGNVLAIADSAAMVEVTNPGAIVCGYKGVKAIIKEMNGKKGYSDYTKWWKTAFDTMDPDYMKAAGRFYALNTVCDNDDVDFLYRMIGEQIGVPAVSVARNLDKVAKDRPALYEKIKKTGIDQSLDKVNIDLGKVMDKPKQGA